VQKSNRTLLCITTILVWVFLFPGVSGATDSSSTRLHPIVSINGYYRIDSEYLPQIKHDVSHLIEWGNEFDFSLMIKPDFLLRFGGGYGTLRQENILMGDDDYALKHKRVFMGFSLIRDQYFSSYGEIAFARFVNDGHKGYYLLDDDEDLLTGSLNCTWQSQSWRMTGKYYRSRETDLVYNFVEERALLKLKTQELAGVEVGYRVTPAWEAAVSFYHESYGTDQEDQYNVNGQVAYRTQIAALSRIAAGAGYYLEEQETIVNLTVEGGFSEKNSLSWGWNSEVEWADVDESILVGGRLWWRLNLNRKVALQLQLEGEQELGRDKDTLAAAFISLNVTL